MFELKSCLPKIHTRQKKLAFKVKERNIKTISPSLLATIHHEPSLDASAALIIK